MTTLAVNGVTLGFYPDEGDAGGTTSYLSDLNNALALSWPAGHHTMPVPTIAVVGWYAQTYPGEEFTGFQLMPLVDDITREHTRCHRRTRFVYEASVMPFQSWTGYTPENDIKAKEVAQVMQTMLERSRAGDEFAIAEIRLRFGHEMNYYISSGLYPPPTTADRGWDYRTAFTAVALACRDLAPQYRERIKLFWCPNIASTSSGAEAEYDTFLPPLEHIDYVGIDYYCPAAGNLDASDFVRKMKRVHDRYASKDRPFVLGETGLQFDPPKEVEMDAKMRWLEVVTGKEARKRLPWMIGLSWFNYEKDRDYRLLWIKREEAEMNGVFVEWVEQSMRRERKKIEGEQGGSKTKRFFKTLLAK
ncbi:Glycoside hydrolase, superfamily [Kalmanozyma brasiliensis GHG001]|uniref:GH26 domain-containing protein n=1 Tax=Kalmanozyma brasiliensis (strain GHG001) TaxID=1365824 RepID=V5F0A4_KALBG|nr:Glycoside hydrolase, superfamily [Kalmanozyma brasiliensis GHG001]EST08619.1 Glycoside hydrolase, superfamily [Kalmanozyma brasiliensis GHG001]